MRIGIVSDTHGHVEQTRAAIGILEELDVTLVVHCGDIGSTSIVPLFSRWPTHFVFGNVDRDETRLQAAIERAGQTCHGRFGSLELEGRKIAFLHSDDDGLFRDTVASRSWDLVCYGHTHVAKQESIGGTIALNPGALFRANPRSFAIVELPELEVSHVTV